MGREKRLDDEWWRWRGAGGERTSNDESVIGASIDCGLRVESRIVAVDSGVERFASRGSCGWIFFVSIIRARINVKFNSLKWKYFEMFV